MRTTLWQIVVCTASLAFCRDAHASEPTWPKTVLAVIEHTEPLKHSLLQEYKRAGLSIDFIFADWEIDGPIEWNGTWATCQRCKRCRDEIPNIGDFRAFQSRLRGIRSEIQRVAFGDNVTDYFPEALVGNYGTYPHDGYRYWYDFFEEEADGVPFQRDQQARYREWAHEFDACGYSVAMPVVYTWYRTFRWYDFSEFDYRWFYNMLRIGSNAGKHTDRAVAMVPFVHWTTTAPPPQSDPGVKQFSQDKSRFMAYNAIAHGAKGVLYWGSNYIDEPEFRQSLYALTAELARLQPFLTGDFVEGVGTNVIDDLFDPPGRGVRAMLLKGGSDYLLILVNEDNHRHLGVDVTGLLAVEGRELSLLYGSQSAKVTDASLVTRMQPFDVKLFCTTKQRFERQQEDGRDFGASGQ